MKRLFYLAVYKFARARVCIYYILHLTRRESGIPDPSKLVTITQIASKMISMRKVTRYTRTTCTFSLLTIYYDEIVDYAPRE